jgi:hypothetical protein
MKDVKRMIDSAEETKIGKKRMRVRQLEVFAAAVVAMVVVVAADGAVVLVGVAVVECLGPEVLVVLVERELLQTGLAVACR